MAPASLPPAAPPPSNEPMYPVIEQFVERATSTDIDALFTSVRDGLKTLKGPGLAQAAKVTTALESAEALLRHLLEVREKMEVERRDGRGSKK